MNSIRAKWRKTTVARSLSVLTRQDQRRVILVILFQISLSILDLIGVVLVGLLGTLAISGVQSQKPNGRVSSFLTFLHLENSTLQTQASILGLGAAFFLITRSLLSVVISRKILFFLSRRSALISSRLISKLLTQSLLEIQAKTIQQTIYSVTQGVVTITVGVLGISISLIADSALILVMAVGLFYVDPVISVGTFLVFASIASLMYKLLHTRARVLGEEDTRLGIASTEKIMEVLVSYRESVVRNRRHFYAREIGELRLQQADTIAEMSFVPNISKYVIETTVVLGALLLGAAQFITQDAVHAVATLSIFLAAGTRIAPAILRMQQGALQIRGSLGSAAPTLELIERLRPTEELAEGVDTLDLVHSGFVAEICVEGLAFTYPKADTPAVNNVSFQVNPGEFVAFVGSSGAGKTSLVDLILGVLQPNSGQVTVSGLQPLEAVSKWPGSVSYVPQDVSIANGSFRENVCLGYPDTAADDAHIWNCLRAAQLEEFVQSLPNKLNSQVGERGTSLSGGQRQRLGIARALFTNPMLLVLDEATSALDGETEANIAETLVQLRGKTTVIMIAHRLSTIMNADCVYFLENGSLRASGTFTDVRNLVPEFEKQAHLMGLS
jgi:ABC-type multidrug transport system fused ATPase/permease subunit